MRGEAALVAQLANAMNSGMQAAERLGEALANFGRARSPPRGRNGKVPRHRLEQFGEIVLLAVGDVAFTEDGLADALDQRLGEIECAIRGSRSPPLDALHLLPRYAPARLRSRRAHRA